MPLLHEPSHSKLFFRSKQDVDKNSRMEKDGDNYLLETIDEGQSSEPNNASRTSQNYIGYSQAHNLCLNNCMSEPPANI